MEPTGLIPFPAFMVVWLGYGLLGLPLFFSRNLPLKQRWFRPYVIGAGVLFLAGMAVTGFPLFMVLIAALPVAIVTKLNLRSIRFCQKCGATIIQRAFFQQPQFCSRCGAPLHSDITPPAP